MARSSLYPTDPKTCSVCGAIFEIHEKEKPVEFARRQTCGPKCGYVVAATKRRAIFTERACVSCGKALERNPGEKTSDFRTRKTCGVGPCKDALMSQVNRAPVTERWCVICGVAFTRDEGEAEPSFQQRKTCGPECRSELKSRSGKVRYVGPPRFCWTCGNPLIQKTYESVVMFARRKTCDRACGVTLGKVTLWRGKGHTSPYPPDWTLNFRKAIRERDNHCCRLCGALPGKRNHHVHHIDAVKANLDERNLITLCPPCHGKVTRGDQIHWCAVLSALMTEVHP